MIRASSPIRGRVGLLARGLRGLGARSLGALSLGALMLGASLLGAGCARNRVPDDVRARVAYTSTNPAGTWVRDDGSASITLAVPEGNRQIFAVHYVEGPTQVDGEALVEGDRVYLTWHTGLGMNDVLLRVYRRDASGDLDGVWGGRLHPAVLGYEHAHRTTDRGGWNGVFATWSNWGGLSYSERLLIGSLGEGAGNAHRLMWIESDRGWFRGLGFEFEDRLVAVKTPGVLVNDRYEDTLGGTLHIHSATPGARTLWFVGAYRAEGDTLVGSELSNIDERVSPSTWRRAGSAAAPAVQGAPPASASPASAAAPAAPPAASDAAAAPAPATTPSTVAAPSSSASVGLEGSAPAGSTQAAPGPGTSPAP